MKKQNFFDKVFSIDEFRFSILGFSFLALVVMFIITGEISDNFLLLAQSLVYSIAGISAVGGVVDVIKNKNGKGKEITREYEDNRGDEPEFRV